MTQKILFVDYERARVHEHRKICIAGASGKLGKYMLQHALDRGYEMFGVCRQHSVSKLDAFKERITVVPGPTNDHNFIKNAVAGCDGVLTVLVPWGADDYSSGAAQAVLDHARDGAPGGSRHPDHLVRSQALQSKLATHPHRRTGEGQKSYLDVQPAASLGQWGRAFQDAWNLLFFAIVAIMDGGVVE